MIKVKPLNEDKDTGWHDDNGRFCLPMSDGYYIKFPKNGDKHSLVAVWYHNTPIGGAALHKDAKRIAQDHHEHRILSALSDEVDEAEERAAFETWAAEWWPISNPLAAAWTGWFARAGGKS